jgi:hypothetical protein
MYMTLLLSYNALEIFSLKSYANSFTTYSMSSHSSGHNRRDHVTIELSYDDEAAGAKYYRTVHVPARKYKDWRRGPSRRTRSCQ